MIDTVLYLRFTACFSSGSILNTTEGVLYNMERGCHDARVRPDQLDTCTSSSCNGAAGEIPLDTRNDADEARPTTVTLFNSTESNGMGCFISSNLLLWMAFSWLKHLLE